MDSQAVEAAVQLVSKLEAQVIDIHQKYEQLHALVNARHAEHEDRLGEHETRFTVVDAVTSRLMRGFSSQGLILESIDAKLTVLALALKVDLGSINALLHPPPAPVDYKDKK
jgi:hypothetical protein